jgi:hypothetical protein
MVLLNAASGVVRMLRCASVVSGPGVYTQHKLISQHSLFCPVKDQ